MVKLTRQENDSIEAELRGDTPEGMFKCDFCHKHKPFTLESTDRPGRCKHCNGDGDNRPRQSFLFSQTRYGKKRPV